MNKREKKNKKYGKKLKSAGDNLEIVNDVLQILMPFFIISTIVLAPFGIIGTVFAALLVTNFFAFSILSSPWVEDFKNGAKEIVDMDKQHTENLAPLKEQIISLNKEKTSVENELKEGERQIDEMLKKAQELKIEASKRQEEYDNLSALIKEFSAFSQATPLENNKSKDAPSLEE